MHNAIPERPRRTFLFLLSIGVFLGLLSLFSPVFASEINATVNITEWDDALGQHFGLSGDDAHTSGGLVLTTIIWAMVFIPSIIFARGKYIGEIVAVSLVLPALLGVSFGWLDGWVTIFMVVMASLVLAVKVGGVFDSK